MKKIHFCWACLRSALQKIHLVDKCLIIFMSVLLLQSAYSLFFTNNSDQDIDNIDVVVRTSSAAIFGYFLSANFIRHAKTIEKEKTAPGKSQVCIKCVEIAPEQPQSTPIQPREKEASPVAMASRLQIIAATAIGLFCLVSLLLLRDFAERGVIFVSSSSIAATVTQFRDFISGCVGFLIGCPTDSQK